MNLFDTIIGSLMFILGIAMVVLCVVGFASITAPAYIIAILFGFGASALGFSIATGQFKY
jgi:hypothetical protein